MQSIPLADLQHTQVAKAMRSIIAVHIAAANCDYYITKYQTKPLEQLQNIIVQYALGLKRYEDNDPAEELPVKRKAQSVTLRLAAAANRCIWVSSTELALFIETEEHFWTTHFDAPIFLSRALYLANECKRLLQNCEANCLLEAQHVPLDAFEIRAEDPARAEIDRVPEQSQLPDNESPVSVPSESAHSCEEADSNGDEDDSDRASSAEQPAQKKDEFALRATCSRHDDWLHRGPFLYSLNFMVYMSRIERVRKTDVIAGKVNAFPFSAHYSLSLLYTQKFSDRAAQIPQLGTCFQAAFV